MRVAIVHYWFVSRRGGERVVEALCELFPQADLFALVADRKTLSPELQKHKLTTSFLQKLPGSRKWHRHMLPAVSAGGGTVRFAGVRPGDFVGVGPGERSAYGTGDLSHLLLPHAHEVHLEFLPGIQERKRTGAGEKACLWTDGPLCAAVGPGERGARGLFCGDLPQCGRADQKVLSAGSRSDLPARGCERSAALRKHRGLLPRRGPVGELQTS